MKTTVLAASAIVALLVLGATTVAFAHAGFGLGGGSSSSQNSTHSSASGTATTSQSAGHEQDNETEDQNSQGNQNDQGGHFNLTVGTTLTLTNLTGHWVAFSNNGNHSDVREGDEGGFFNKTGNSTGAFTFKVTGASDGGFNLTITSGNFVINGTTYTVSSGQLTLNAGDESGFGNGTASGGAIFQIHVGGIHGNITSSALVGAIRLDVKVGTGEYLVILGSSEGVGEQASED